MRIGNRVVHAIRGLDKAKFSWQPADDANSRSMKSELSAPFVFFADKNSFHQG